MHAIGRAARSSPWIVKEHTDVSTELAISTRGLRKTYRNRRGQRAVAVGGLDLDVPVGGVHGFLGPNGAGKTTTIRMLLGLIRADSGTMSLFGQEVPQRLPEVIGRVGAIVEQPKFFPSFSGRKNLTMLARAIEARRRWSTWCSPTSGCWTGPATATRATRWA